VEPGDRKQAGQADRNDGGVGPDNTRASHPSWKRRAWTSSARSGDERHTGCGGGSRGCLGRACDWRLRRARSATSAYPAQARGELRRRVPVAPMHARTLTQRPIPAHLERHGQPIATPRNTPAGRDAALHHTPQRPNHGCLGTSQRVNTHLRQLHPHLRSHRPKVTHLHRRHRTLASCPTAPRQRPAQPLGSVAWTMARLSI
jgi:hypothetical protein